MKKPSSLNPAWVLSAVLTSAVITGCGGGGGSAAAGAPTIDPSQSVAAVVSYINGLISGTPETGDVVNVNALTLAVDDIAEPSAIN